MLSDDRLFQISKFLQHKLQRTYVLHWCCKMAKAVFIGVHGRYCFHVAERASTDLYPQDQRSVCMQMSNHSEHFLVPNFLAVMQKVVDNM